MVQLFFFLVGNVLFDDVISVIPRFNARLGRWVCSVTQKTDTFPVGAKLESVEVCSFISEYILFKPRGK